MLFCLGFVGTHVQHIVLYEVAILHMQFYEGASRCKDPNNSCQQKIVCQRGCNGRHTWHAMFKVIVWSFRMLLLGYVFDYLPGDEIWEQERGRLVSGTKLAGHALVLQCRGDWPFLKQLLLGSCL